MINHIYLTINNFDKQISWFETLFNILDFKKDFIYPDGGFVTFEKDNLAIGLVASSQEFKADNFERFRVGMSHFALEIDSRDQLTKVASLIKSSLSPKLREDLEMAKHHGKEYFTFTFFTPDGIMIELIAK